MLSAGEWPDSAVYSLEVRKRRLLATTGLALISLCMGMAYGVTPCISAKGEITCVAAGDLIDGETVTISDPTQSVVFEFEISSNGVGIGNTPVVLDPSDSAADVASALASAVNAMGGSLLVTASSTGNMVYLTQVTPGPAGNIPIQETVASSSFAVSGFSGGRCPDIPSVPIFPIEPALVVATTSALAIGLIRRRG
jgi:hypothetical protein